MTTKLIDVEQLALARQEALTSAEAARKEARENAHREFVAGIKQKITEGEETVATAAEKAGLSRQVMHDLIRRYGS